MLTPVLLWTPLFTVVLVHGWYIFRPLTGEAAEPLPRCTGPARALLGGGNGGLLLAGSLARDAEDFASSRACTRRRWCVRCAP